MGEHIDQDQNIDQAGQHIDHDRHDQADHNDQDHHDDQDRLESDIYSKYKIPENSSSNKRHRSRSYDSRRRSSSRGYRSSHRTRGSRSHRSRSHRRRHRSRDRDRDRDRYSDRYSERDRHDRYSERDRHDRYSERDRYRDHYRSPERHRSRDRTRDRHDPYDRQDRQDRHDLNNNLSLDKPATVQPTGSPAAIPPTTQPQQPLIHPERLQVLDKASRTTSSVTRDNRDRGGSRAKGSSRELESATREKGSSSATRASRTTSSVTRDNRQADRPVDRQADNPVDKPVDRQADKVDRVNPVDKVDRDRKDQELKRRKEIEEAQREDLTVLVVNLHLKADEREIYELFSEQAGKVRDIQCVKDLRSGRSKGVAYVEFYTQEAVIKALSMTGYNLRGQRIRVQSSQAEKNRAARAAKMLQQQTVEGESPFTILVTGLVSTLSAIGQSELKQLFSPFGTIIDVEIPKNDEGEPKGVAFLKFKRASEAKEAMAAMNGFEIGGQQIKVGYANLGTGQNGRLAGQFDGEMLDDEGLISGGANKIALMQKLQRTDPEPPRNGQKAAARNIVLSNMFSANDPSIDDPNFFTEIEEDVQEECSKYGKVEAIHIDRKDIDGKVWIKFNNVADASLAYRSLNGRFFSGNTIVVEYVQEETWKAKCRLGNE